MGPAKAADSSSAAAAAAFSSDKCTSEWQNHKEKRGWVAKKNPKMCTSQHLPACCIIVIFWYTETNAERMETGRWRIHPMIGMIVAASQLFHPTCQCQPLSDEDQMAEYRFKYKTNLYISYLIVFRAWWSSSISQTFEAFKTKTKKDK